MPVITDKPVSTRGEDSGATLQRIYRNLGSTQIEAAFMNSDGSKVSITRDYLEAIIEDYAQQTQNGSFFNKFLQIDTKLEKALREYAADMKMLLASAATMAAAQAQVAPPPQAPAAPIPGAPVENPIQQGLSNPIPEQV